MEQLLKIWDCPGDSVTVGAYDNECTRVQSAYCCMHKSCVYSMAVTILASSRVSVHACAIPGVLNINYKPYT